MNSLIIKKYRNFSFLAMLFCLALSCHNSDKEKGADKLNALKSKNRDTTLLFLDSSKISNFLRSYSAKELYKEKLLAFYTKRNFEFAWCSKKGLNAFALNYINLLNNEQENTVQNETNPYLKKLREEYIVLSADTFQYGCCDALSLNFELLMTLNFFDYAKRNWVGINDTNLTAVAWFMVRKQLNYVQLLDSVLKGEVKKIETFEPVYRQYALLKIELKKYYAIEQLGGWPLLDDSLAELETGSTNFAVSLCKKQLYLTGDYNATDTTQLFDTTFEQAIKKYQKRNGIKASGILTAETYSAMRVPVHERIQQILINMERCRWVPLNQHGDYIVVNIPDYKLYAYHDDKPEWFCNVIVGKSKSTSNTVIFNKAIEYIVFSPCWNIPESILLKETIPEQIKNPNYLRNHNMEVVTKEGKLVSYASLNWNNYRTHFPYIIRQKPGKNNALGLIKFIFPNDYDIYMHDTPSKSLFNEPNPMFSHGCIRVQEPVKLAEFLLRADSTYNLTKINALMNSGKEKYVKLKTKIPVFISYFTSWVDRDGLLNFRKDSYGHDAEMKLLLFAKE